MSFDRFLFKSLGIPRCLKISIAQVKRIGIREMSKNSISDRTEISIIFHQYLTKKQLKTIIVKTPLSIQEIYQIKKSAVYMKNDRNPTFLRKRIFEHFFFIPVPFN